jgi:hypothetical protein
MQCNNSCMASTDQLNWWWCWLLIEEVEAHI